MFSVFLKHVLILVQFNGRKVGNIWCGIYTKKHLCQTLVYRKWHNILSHVCVCVDLLSNAEITYLSACFCALLKATGKFIMCPIWKSFIFSLCACVLAKWVHLCHLRQNPLCCRGDLRPELTVMSRLGDRNTSLSNEGAGTIPKEIHAHWDICTCVSRGKSVSLWQALISVCDCVCVRDCACFSGRIARKKSASEMCFFELVVSSPLPAGKKKQKEIQLQGGQSRSTGDWVSLNTVEHMDG